MKDIPLSDTQERTGGCLCGAVRYRIAERDQPAILCHCSHCQKSSGSAFSTNVMVAPDDIQFEGAATAYEDVGDSGNKVLRFFCPQCGSSLYSRLSNGAIAIKAGSLDDPSTVRPKAQYWTERRQGWLDDIGQVPAA